MDNLLNQEPQSVEVLYVQGEPGVDNPKIILELSMIDIDGKRRSKSVTLTQGEVLKLFLIADVWDV